MFDSGSGQTLLIDPLAAAVLSALEAESVERAGLISLAVNESGVMDSDLWAVKLDSALDQLVATGLIEAESSAL